jgi:hypothetical protein
MTESESELRAYLKNVMSLEYCKYLNIPMDMIDGRPWVPTHAEAHLDLIWGFKGYEWCTHPDCPGPDATPPVGIMNCEGITQHD